MTPNQTIDGVRERLAEIANRDSAVSVTVRAEDLRALLDSTVESCGACNGCSNGCRLDAESPPAQPQGEPVAWQYRVSAGPQTGWSLWHDGKGEEFKRSYQVETRPLYAEQPAPVADPLAKGFTTLESDSGKYKIVTSFATRDDAWSAYHALLGAKPAPVAVVIPERKPVEVMIFNWTTADVENTGWNACLDELKRLNPTL